MMTLHAESKKWVTQRGAENKLAMYGEIGSLYKAFINSTKQVPADILFLFHSSARIIPDDPKEAAKEKARALAGDYDVQPSLTGNIGLQVITANVSMEASLVVKTEPKTKKQTRWLLPGGGEGYRGKNRWQKKLSAREEPHFQKLYAKIKGEA